MPPVPDGDSYVFLPWYIAAHGYHARATRLANGQLYWHAWRDGERFNGGLSPSWTDVQENAAWACYQDITHRTAAPLATGP